MYRLSLAFLALALGTVHAQTPPGWLFTPNTTNTLNLTYGRGNEINPAGKQIPRQDTVAPPMVMTNTTLFNASSLGILFMIDLDVNINNTRIPLLHWLVPGVNNPNGMLNIPVPSTDPNAQPKTNGTPYAQPGPPAGDPAHRYVFLLFHQPSNFTFPASFASINPPAQGFSPTNGRINFNLTKFLEDAQIPNEPLAANFIRVQNNTANPSTSVPPLSSATATSTSVPLSTAGANALSGALGAAAGVFGLAAMIL